MSSQDAPKLKPCPFCGSSDVSVQDDQSGMRLIDWYVCCGDCSCHGPWFHTEAEAITAWNTRKEPDGK